jgi:hypothetical protein
MCAVKGSQEPAVRVEIERVVKCSVSGNGADEPAMKIMGK